DFLQGLNQPQQGPSMVPTPDQLATRDLLTKLRRFFFEQRSRVLASLAQLVPDSRPPFLSDCRLSDLEPKPAGLLDLRSENEKLMSQLGSVLMAQFELGAGRSIKETDLAATAYLRYREHALLSINRATAQNLQQALENALAQNETVRQFTARIRALFNLA